MSAELRPTEQPLTQQQIADYLQRYPDFFEQHPELLLQLNLSDKRHSNATVAPLIDRQLALLREQNSQQQRQLALLKQNARDNEQLLLSLQQLIISLLETNSLDEAIHCLREALMEHFFADVVKIKLFSDRTDRPEYISRDHSRLRPLEALIERKGTICGQLKPEQQQALFGKSEDPPIASSIVIPICRDNGPCSGILAIGSSHRNRYHPDMSTLFITHLGAIIHKIFQDYLS
ncbi:DUF484 family protein [Ectothiorhodospiraceae bacterium BW-2]|nr:DUF484 family protein [Ectothiorhodospiraceae bacterium BW-2]